MKILGPEEIKTIEPNCVVMILFHFLNWLLKKIFIKGLKAIHSPHTGIVDWGLVSRHYGSFFEKHGGKVKLNFEVEDFLTSTSPTHPIRIVSKTNQVWIVKF